MSEIVPTCRAEHRSGEKDLDRVCTLPEGHPGPHWGARAVQAAYGPIAWLGDDSEPVVDPPADPEVPPV